MALHYDPEFAKEAGPIIASIKENGPMPVHDVESRRQFVGSLFSRILESVEDIPSVKVAEHKVKSFDGHEVSVFQFNKETPTIPGPAILYVHGGGMISCDVMTMYAKTLKSLVETTGTQIFAPDYRLAPEHRHPVLQEDVYSSLTWLHSNASQLGIDKSRLAIQGDSAGGGIAAGVALMARDRGLSPPLAKQILLYPMIDDRNTGEKDASIKPYLVLWNEKDNLTGWTAVLGDQTGTDAVSKYAAPAREMNLAGLPSTYIDVGGLDLFRDEAMAYAHKLALANTQVEFHLYAGVLHAWELLAPGIKASQKALANRQQAMTSF